MAVFDIESELKTSAKNGLKFSDIKSRLKSHGSNTLDFEKPPSSWSILRRQCTNIFVIILVIASAIAYYSDGLNQALILWAIITLNILLGFFQENKAEKTLQALKDSVKSLAKVVRDGRISEINSEELVPGDLVSLEQGDQVPADLRLVESHNLAVNQAILTGESAAVRKVHSESPSENSILEADNLVFSGTSIVAGRGRGIVYATGNSCQFGKIAELVSQNRNETPLENRLKYLGKVLTIVSIGLALLLFLSGLLRGWPVLHLLTLSIAILVAIVPESLPTTITLALAIGVVRMAKKKAVVRRLASVETLGIVNVIATDKTGTLTKNELSVAEVIVPEKVRGENPLWKKIVISGDEVISGGEEQSAIMLVKKALLCTDATVADNKAIGDPIEVAILNSAVNFNINIVKEKGQNSRINEIPFDSAKGYMVTLHKGKSGKFLVVKGSFEKIGSFCRLSSEQRRLIDHLADSMAKEGMRVLAVAEKKVSGLEESSLRNLEFLGLLGMIDLPSESAMESITRSIQAGVRPIIVTGDNSYTATYIAEAVGMDIARGEVMEGHQLDRLSLAGLKQALKKIKIFSRVSPENKIEVVKALKKTGAIVAVTGDGVNDAPALKAADVGVAMGRGGTAVAREAADIILLDNNYGTIVEAIRLGRTIYENIQKAIVFLLSGNFGELIVVSFAILMNLPMPLTAIQILWMNLVTDGLPAMAFAFEPPDENALLNGPRDSRKSVIRNLLLYSFILVLVAMPFEIYVYLYYLKTAPELTSTVVVTFMTYIAMALAVSIHSKDPFWRNIKAMFRNSYLWGAIVLSILLQYIFVETSLSKFLGFTNIDLPEYTFIIINTLIIFVLAEVVKSFYYRRCK